MTNIKKTISSIDIGKFIACFFIVLLHCHVIDYSTNWTGFAITAVLLRISVPFFFVASGFFLGNKISKGNDVKSTIYGYCKRLLFPLIVFSIINIAQHLYTFYCDGETVAKSLFRVFRSIIFYPYGALWFAQSCIIGALILIPFLNRKKIGLAVAVGVLLFTFALFFNSYYFVVHGTVLGDIVDKVLKIVASLRNGVFVGFVYLAIGAYIGYNKISVSRRLGGAMFVLSIIALFLEVRFVWTHWVPKDDTSLFISHLFMAPTILLMLLRLSISIPVSLSIILRNLSVGVYFLHKPILYFVSTYCPESNLIAFIVTYLISVVICLCFYKLNFNVTNKLLK